jgi:hypothetical protein
LFEIAFEGTPKSAFNTEKARLKKKRKYSFGKKIKNAFKDLKMAKTVKRTFGT